MDGTLGIGPVERLLFGRARRRGEEEEREAGSRFRRRRRGLDEVRLTPPVEVTLRLLRERILERTRQALSLPVDRRTLGAFVAAPGDGTEQIVGRLISEQNWLAGRRRAEWGEARVAAALQEGTTRGLEETIEILEDLGELDAQTWELIGAVTDEMHRKLFGSGGT